MHIRNVIIIMQSSELNVICAIFSRSFVVARRRYRASVALHEQPVFYFYASQADYLFVSGERMKCSHNNHSAHCCSGVRALLRVAFYW